MLRYLPLRLVNIDLLGYLSITGIYVDVVIKIMQNFEKSV